MECDGLGLSPEALIEMAWGWPGAAPRHLEDQSGGIRDWRFPLTRDAPPEYYSFLSFAITDIVKRLNLRANRLIMTYSLVLSPFGFETYRP
jgi:hypothetical protein